MFTVNLNISIMRKLSIFLLLCISSSLLYAQVFKTCHGPIPIEKFRQKLEMISSTGNEIQKLNKAKDLASEFCLNSMQVKAVAETFLNDFTRLDFAEVAFINVTDPENFYDVYDAFAYFSNVFRLHDFVLSVVSTALPPVPPPPPCIVTDNDFILTKQAIEKQSFNATRLSIAKQVIQAKQCFSSIQIKEIVMLFSFEESRLEIAKYAYDFCMDKRNYFQVNDALKHSSSVEELGKYITTKH